MNSVVSEARNVKSCSKVYHDICTPPQKNRRRGRTSYTQYQIEAMESLFAHNQYPGINEREELSGAVGIPEARIQVKIDVFIIS